MTLLDSLRSVATPRGQDPETRALPAGVVGALAATATAVPLLLVVVLGWLAAGQRGTGLGEAVGLGADLWLLGSGARIAAGGGVDVALTPLALFATLLWVATRGARRVLRSVEDDGPLWRGVVEAGRARALALFVGGHAAVAVVLALLSLLGSAHPSVLSVGPAVLGIPLLASVIALGRHVSETEDASFWAGLRVPLTVRRAVPAALWGAGLVLAGGAVLVLGALVFHLGRVGHISAELGAGLVGTSLLWVGQLAALPNLALWAVSFVAGSGYSLGEGAAVTWDGATGGLLPLIPVLAASPQVGSFPVVVPVLVLLPVAAGFLVGRRALASVPRLARTMTKLGVTVTAAVLVAVALGILDAVGGGALGGYRLADLGAPAFRFALTLAAELALGAVLATGWDLRQLHRR